ncbi:hypothetical protein Mgra_00004764 [Meloidogyne graminicola]|uniref:Uncharacterized protein n=1 Tax=Meloidogyne graminicola TaxID=189291 RepID=A0A8S9ZRI7_9BILA|nr:hypothetical protein Mgra_00004764 [Meloidogyne graminicola]
MKLCKKKYCYGWIIGIELINTKEIQKYLENEFPKLIKYLKEDKEENKLNIIYLDNSIYQNLFKYF